MSQTLSASVATPLSTAPAAICGTVEEFSGASYDDASYDTEVSAEIIAMDDFSEPFRRGTGAGRSKRRHRKTPHDAPAATSCTEAAASASSKWIAYAARASRCSSDNSNDELLKTCTKVRCKRRLTRCKHVEPSTRFRSLDDAASIVAAPSAPDKGQATSSAVAATPRAPRTEDVYNRLRWDADRYDASEWVIGYLDRFLGVCELPFYDFARIPRGHEAVSDAGIPLHRIVHFRNTRTGAVLQRSTKYAELDDAVIAAAASASTAAA